jgi:hypothetical protein
MFLCSRKYDPGFLSWIRIRICYLSRIPDPGVKKAPDPESGSVTLFVVSYYLYSTFEMAKYDFESLKIQIHWKEGMTPAVAGR